MGFSSWFSRKSPTELLRENQRLLNRSIRELDRERAGLEAQEKRLIADIKKTAKAGQMNSVKIMAMDLVRTRRYIQKFYAMRAQLQAVSLRLQTMKSNHAMAEAMRGVTKAMRSMNSKINLPGIQKIMMEFEKQNQMMEMKEEMMTDAMDSAMDEEGDEEESDEIVNKVLDEIGVSFNDMLVAAPSSSLNKSSQTEASVSDAALEARLQNLRKV